VVVVHDTTSFEFPHADPREVGFLQTGKPGFYAHFSLAVSGAGKPLGVVGLSTIFRKQRSRKRPRNLPGSVTTKQADRESKRWEEAVLATESVLEGAHDRIHVADREADSYQMLATLHASNSRYVIRVRHDRRARAADDDGADWSTLKTLAETGEAFLEREVPISRRAQSSAPRQRRSNPARKARAAKLRVTATSMTLRRPRYLHDVPAEITVNVVRVHEPEPPKGEEAIEWLLVTREPVDTPAQVASVVDTYRLRWLIEEYFKAIKTGCVYEERQLESKHGLLNALAIFAPIACHMLWLRSCARRELPATEALTRRQLEVLRAIAKRPIPSEATARDVLWAIAGLGGHLKRNGEPGWLTLRRGLEKLLAAELGWAAARGHQEK
jgi:hypothetical protein